MKPLKIALGGRLDKSPIRLTGLIAVMRVGIILQGQLVVDIDRDAASVAQSAQTVEIGG